MPNSWQGRTNVSYVQKEALAQQIAGRQAVHPVVRDNPTIRRDLEAVCHAKLGILPKLKERRCAISVRTILLRLGWAARVSWSVDVKMDIFDRWIWCRILII